jgi:hypothetical protein
VGELLELKVGDVVFVPGFTSVQNPARITIVEQESDLCATPLILGHEEANRMFARYATKKYEMFEGSFWRVERPTPSGMKQVWPEVEG